MKSSYQLTYPDVAEAIVVLSGSEEAAEATADNLSILQKRAEQKRNDEVPTERTTGTQIQL